MTNEPLTTYLLPARSAPSQATLIVLHGLGDSAQGWAGFPGQLGLASLSYLFADAPDPYYGGYAWYDFYGEQSEGVQRSRGLLHHLIAAEEARGTPASKIGILGFSQGCVMAFDAGWRFPRRLGALVGISGYIFEPEVLLCELGPEAKSVPALFTHGTEDPVVLIEPVRDQARQLQAAGLDLTWKEYRKAHTVAGEAEVGVIRSFLVKSLGLVEG
jgi:phospholipase/carboxylesterase